MEPIRTMLGGIAAAAMTAALMVLGAPVAVADDGVTISGTVRDAATGAGVPGATVQLFRTVAGMQDAPVTATADAAGAWSASGLGAGEYRVATTGLGPTHDPAYPTSVVDWPAPGTRVTVPAGGSAVADTSIAWWGLVDVDLAMGYAPAGGSNVPMRAELVDASGAVVHRSQTWMTSLQTAPLAVPPDALGQPLRLRLVANGLLAGVAPAPAQSAPFTAASRATTSTAIALELGARIDGSFALAPDVAVTQQPPGTRIAQVVLLQRVGDAWVPLQAGTATQAGHQSSDLRLGAFSFGGLGPGSYVLGASAGVVAPALQTCEAWWGGASLATATRIEIAAAGQVRTGVDAVLDDCDALEPLPQTDRIAGVHRYATAVALAQSTHPGGADVVYLASGESFPDGLSAGPAAAREDAPLLLSMRDGVPQNVLDELARLAPQRIVMVGGTGALSDGVAGLVEGATGADVVRIGGANRFETSRLVAQSLWQGWLPDLYLASGLAFPDALAAGAAAGAVGAPLLLVDGSQPGLDAATRALVDAFDVEWAHVAGGRTAMHPAITSDLWGLAYEVTVAAGPDRYATAALLAPPVDGVPVTMATGAAFPDALAASAAAGAAGGVLLLSLPQCVPVSALEVLARTAPSSVTLLGSEAALSSAVARYQRC